MIKLLPLRGRTGNLPMSSVYSLMMGLPSKAIWSQMFRRSSLNATTWSSLGVPATFVRFSHTTANRQVLSTTEVMAMATASGEPELCGWWEEPRSGLRSNNVRFYRSWFRYLGANAVGTSVVRTGRELIRSAPQTRTASGR